MKFVSLPLKKGEPVDWVAPLKSYLNQIYGSYGDFEDAVQEFDKLRNDMIHADQDAIARDIYYRYYGQLESLEMRVPVDLLRVMFTWRDAFSKSKETTQQSVAFEKASVLFNLASLFSSLGAQSARDDDLKQSYLDFQKAAGIYQFVQENFMHAPSADLSVSSVKAFHKLMLAQAQEAFLLKYLGSGAALKPSLVARLAQSAATMYKASWELTRQVSFFPEEQDDFTKLKSMYYQSLAHYYNAQVEQDKDEYGLAVANLSAAESDLDGFNRWSISFDSTIFSELKDQMELVRAKLKELEKDNDFIYHQLVPKANTLAPIKPLDSSKATALADQQVKSYMGHDLFERIIPMSVHEKSSLYSEEKAQIMRDQEDVCATAEEEYKSTLEFLKMPDSVNQLRQLCGPSAQSSSEEVDPRVLAMASEVSNNAVDVATPTKLRRDLQDTVDRCAALLEQDEDRFNKSKTKYGAQWTQEQVPAELVKIKEQLGLATKSLSDATDSDLKIRGFYDSHKTEIETLKLGPSDPKFLAAFSPDETNKVTESLSLLDLDEGSTVDEGAAIRKQVDSIDSKLRNLRLLQKERANTLSDLKGAVREDDISNLLVANSDKEDMSDLFAQELQKFKPYEDRINATVAKQTELISALKKQMADILDDPKVKTRMRQRDTNKTTHQAKTEAFIAAFDSWKAYKSGCDQAPVFYRQLLQFATNLKYKIEKYVGARTNEGNRLVQSIQARATTEQDLLRQSMSRYSVSSTGSGSGSFPPYAAPPSSYPPGPPPQYSRAPASGSGAPPPPLPSKPQNRPQQPSQPPQQPQSQSDFYNTPSAYDPSLYSKFGGSWQ